MQKEIMEQIKRMANELELPSALIPSDEDIQTWKLTYGDKVESYNKEKELALSELEKYCNTEKEKEYNSSVIEFDKRAEHLQEAIADLRADSLRKTELLKSLGLFAVNQKKQLKSEIIAIEKKISDETSTFAREYDHNAKEAMVEEINNKWEDYQLSKIDEIEKKYSIPANPEEQYSKVVSALSKMKELHLASEDKNNTKTQRYNELVKLRILAILSNSPKPLTLGEVLEVYDPVFDDQDQNVMGSKMAAMLYRLKDEDVIQRIDKGRKSFFTLA